MCASMLASFVVAGREESRWRRGAAYSSTRASVGRLSTIAVQRISRVSGSGNDFLQMTPIREHSRPSSPAAACIGRVGARGVLVFRRGVRARLRVVGARFCGRHDGAKKTGLVGEGEERPEVGDRRRRRVALELDKCLAPSEQSQRQVPRAARPAGASSVRVRAR